MTPPLSVQLFSLAPRFGHDPAGALARLAALGFTGIAPMISTGTPEPIRAMASTPTPDGLASGVEPAVLRRLADEHGISIGSAHVHLPEGDTAEQVFDEQELLGNRYLITSVIWDESSGWFHKLESLDAIKQLVERVDAAAERARARGMRIGYHNHSWEFGTDYDGRTGLEVFFDLVAPDVVAEIDVYWAQLGDCDPLRLIDGLGDRTLLLHLKDGNGVIGDPSSALGAGTMDLGPILGVGAHAEWNVVELEGLGDAVWPALEQSAAYLAELYGSGVVDQH
jgi:sugar phosphate isomerase/epimerase